jgi:imidazolonepropionase-like amidohydrolase
MTSTVFEGIQVFDGVHPATKDSMHVLVEDNEIKEVSAKPVGVGDADRIDGRGKTLMPGLIDNHVHIYIESLKLHPPEPPITYRAQYAQTFLRHIVSCGFTSVRDVAGGDHGMAMALRERFFDGPRFFYGGLCLTQTGGHGDYRLTSEPTDYLSCGVERHAIAIRADGVDDCIRKTREELRKGASHIKIMGSGGIMSPSDPLYGAQYSEAEIRAIVEECTRHGAYVCAHCYPAPAIRRCVEFGVRCIEHGTLIDAETAQFVAEKGAFVVPTVYVVHALVEDGLEGGVPAISMGKLAKVREHSIESLKIMKAAGVKMGYGTDLLGPQHTRRDAEFTLRSQALSPFDILHSATAINAEILQMQGKLGVVKVGALADLLVVDGNPLMDINLLGASGRHLTHIMVDGRFVKRPAQGM